MGRPRRKTAMASGEGKEQTSGGTGRESAAPEESGEETAVLSQSGKRVMAAFRIPTQIHAELVRGANDAPSDLTAYVNKIFASFLHFFSLPSVVEDELERDRQALGFGRFEYYQYVLFRRYEAVTRSGPGFDRAGLEKQK